MSWQRWIENPFSDWEQLCIQAHHIGNGVRKGHTMCVREMIQRATVPSEAARALCRDYLGTAKASTHGREAARATQ